MQAIKIILIIILWVFFGVRAFAQTEHHHQHKIPEENPKKDSTFIKQKNQNAHKMESKTLMPEERMTSRYSRNLPMSRDGSGTSWLPDNSPMFMYMKHTGNWNLMFHGNVFLRYNIQDIKNQSRRGSDQIDAPNMFMGMAQRKVGTKGLLNFNLMFSLDRFVMGGDGYPLLFQTGETWKGKRLVDRQHPHDLFAELSIGYTHKITDEIDLISYFGFPAEPAIGPVTFMHRVSGLSNPDAPLGHHWQDATHITFGVGTFGLRYKKFKLEASIFTGREPDENRFDFDKPGFNSFSQRLSFNPTESWAFQISQGLIKSPEAIDPDEDVRRITGSAIHNTEMQNRKYWANSFVFGLNQSHHSSGLSLLYESHLQLKKFGFYGRTEWVQKDSVELQLSNIKGHHLNIGTITLGTSYLLKEVFQTNFSIGAQTIFFLPNDELKKIYNGSPMAFEIYLHLKPAIIANYNSDSHNH